MRTPLFTAQEFPILLFDPEMAPAGQLAARLQEHHIHVAVTLGAEDALQSAKGGHFRVLVVAADAGNRDCLRFLHTLRRAAPRSWLVVMNPKIDRITEALLRRHGTDAVVRAPVDIEELARRISLLQVRLRPLF